MTIFRNNRNFSCGRTVVRGELFLAFMTAVLSACLWLPESRVQAEETVPAAVLPQVSTDFPGGSAEVHAFDPETGELHISPALRSDQGWPCWWYLRLEGLTPGQKLTLKVSANPQPFRGQTKLAANWSQPTHAAWSLDNKTWSQTAACRKEAGVAIYELEVPASQIWLAWGPPFLPSHTEELLRQIVKKHPAEAELFELAKTRNGQPVQGIKIGCTDAGMARFGVWVQARQHAWESGSSWVAQGFLEWITSDEPAAVQLRQTTTIYVVPIMDVDNVLMGAGGKDAVPRDHNRDWTEASLYPEVTAAQQQIKKMHADGKLQMYLDLHNPDAAAKQPFFFAPFHLRNFSASQQDNYARFLAMCVGSIRSPLAIQPEFRFTNYVKSEEELQRMSKEWVLANTSRDIISLTLETAWNTENSTQTGYRQVGQQLAEAVARYLSRQHLSED